MEREIYIERSLVCMKIRRKVITAVALVGVVMLSSCSAKNEDDSSMAETTSQQVTTTQTTTVLATTVPEIRTTVAGTTTQTKATTNLPEVTTQVETTSATTTTTEVVSTTSSALTTQTVTTTTVVSSELPVATPMSYVPENTWDNSEYTDEWYIDSGSTDNNQWYTDDNQEYIDGNQWYTDDDKRDNPDYQTEHSFSGMRELPENVMSVVRNAEYTYPGLTIGVGIYALDGSCGYEYNAYTPINGGCTVKAPYEMAALKYCASQGIDIYNTSMQYYASQFYHGGSGLIIKPMYDDYGNYNYYSGYDGRWYTYDELFRVMITDSDNSAFDMAVSQIPLWVFYEQNIPLGGQSDWSQWGSASAHQRGMEWIEINRYINSGEPYSDVLRDNLSCAKFCYFNTSGHWVLHKSGWNEDPSYPSECDCAIIDGEYILVVMTQDYQNWWGHGSLLYDISVAVEDYQYWYGLF